MDKRVATLGTISLSQSQVLVMAKEVDAYAEELHTRQLNLAGPFTFVAADVLVLKVREGGRGVPVHAPGRHPHQRPRAPRGPRRLSHTTSANGDGWPSFFGDLTSRTGLG